MNRLNAILKGQFFGNLLGLKKRKIYRAIEAATDYAKTKKEDAQIAYEQLFADMAADDADYERIIGKMLEHKQTIIAADHTIEAIEAIKADLESEVPDTEEKK